MSKTCKHAPCPFQNFPRYKCNIEYIRVLSGFLFTCELVLKTSVFVLKKLIISLVIPEF